MSMFEEDEQIVDETQPIEEDQPLEADMINQIKLMSESEFQDFIKGFEDKD